MVRAGSKNNARQKVTLHPRVQRWLDGAIHEFAGLEESIASAIEWLEVHGTKTARAIKDKNWAQHFPGDQYTLLDKARIEIIFQLDRPGNAIRITGIVGSKIDGKFEFAFVIGE